METDEIEATAYVMDIKETTFAAEMKENTENVLFCGSSIIWLLSTSRPLFDAVYYYQHLHISDGSIVFLFFSFYFKDPSKREEEEEKKRADTKECLMMIASKKF